MFWCKRSLIEDHFDNWKHVNRRDTFCCIFQPYKMLMFFSFQLENLLSKFWGWSENYFSIIFVILPKTFFYCHIAFSITGTGILRSGRYFSSRTLFQFLNSIFFKLPRSSSLILLLPTRTVTDHFGFALTCDIPNYLDVKKDKISQNHKNIFGRISTIF